MKQTEEQKRNYAEVLRSRARDKELDANFLLCVLRCPVDYVEQLRLDALGYCQGKESQLKRIARPRPNLARNRP